MSWCREKNYVHDGAMPNSGIANVLINKQVHKANGPISSMHRRKAISLTIAISSSSVISSNSIVATAAHLILQNCKNWGKLYYTQAHIILYA